MAIGQMLAFAGMSEGLQVSYYPAYGPQMRGGSANCSVILSDSKIGSSIVSKPDYLIAMNEDGFLSYADKLSEKGQIYANSSLIPEDMKKPQVACHFIAANAIAGEIGNPRAANMVMLGAFNAAVTRFKEDTLYNAFVHVFGERRAHLFDINKQAMEKGAETVLKNSASIFA